mgnify:CR=1 FL=1
MENNEKEVLFSVSHLKKYFQVGNRATLKAVDDVSFDIYKGETLGMVGESGCGKTTCGRTCIGLYDKTDGQVLYKGTDVHALNGKERFAFKKTGADGLPGSVWIARPTYDSCRYHRRGNRYPSSGEE